jgi:hypothetical protein
MPVAGILGHVIPAADIKNISNMPKGIYKHHAHQGYQKGHAQFSEHRFPKGHTPHNKGVKGYENAGTFKVGHQGLVGDKNPSWKDGKTQMINEWRKSVYERDNYICQMCGDRGKYLNAHHIKERSIYPELKYSIDNGISLCRPCHIRVHKEKGWLNQYKKHYETYT